MLFVKKRFKVIWTLTNKLSKNDVLKNIWKNALESTQQNMEKIYYPINLIIKVIKMIETNDNRIFFPFITRYFFFNIQTSGLKYNLNKAWAQINILYHTNLK